MARGTRIKGLDELKDKLEFLQRGVQKTVLRKATRAAVTVIRKAVVVATPVDQGVLKKMQIAKVTSRGRQISGIVGADVEKLKSAESAQGLPARPSNIDWLVENGHVTPEGKVVPASGYMRRAADESMPAAQLRFQEKLTEEIEKEWAK